MMTAEVNYWAVLVAALGYFFFGAVWYSPPLFGKAWMKGIGKTKEQLTAEFSAIKYVWAFIASFLAAYGIARIMSWTGDMSVTNGISVGLLAAISFVLSTFFVNDSMEGRPRGLTALNILYHIIGFIIIGLIIGIWP